MSDLMMIPLVTPVQLTVLTLTACREDLRSDFAGACMRWDIRIQVGVLVSSITDEQIFLLANRTACIGMVRLMRGDDAIYWSDLFSAPHGQHSTRADTSLVTALAQAVEPPLVTPVQLVAMALLAAREDLKRDFFGACHRWEFCAQVGELLMQASDAMVHAVAANSQGLQVMRVMRGDNHPFWTDLLRALKYCDASGVDLSLITSALHHPVVDRTAA